MQIALSIGELAGIGPNIALMHIQHTHAPLVAFADREALAKRAELLGLPVIFTDTVTTEAGKLCVHHIPSNITVTPGNPHPDNAEYVLSCLRAATEFCLQTGAPLLTLPLHKGVINKAGISFSGHTEYLADITHTKKVVMLLKCKQLAVALATTHVPLSMVSEHITSDSLSEIMHIIHYSFNQYYHTYPAIMTLGLNPHAGEDGYLGREELEVINPTILKMQQQGINITGAIPADTAFSQENMKHYDVFLAMYHDQGLSVLKTLCFNNAVNITLGLPIHRVSVDHGTAFDLAHTTNIHLGSFAAALNEVIPK